VIGYDSGMDEDDYTIDCPHCGAEIYDEAQQCPSCSQYISAADFKKPVPKWVFVIIALTILSFLLPTILTALRSFSGQ
jgi:uncharacterized membrane protein YvbJ